MVFYRKILNCQLIICSVLMVSFSDLYSQEFDCSEFYRTYCNQVGVDSIQIRKNTIDFPDNGGNVTVNSILGCINNLDAFCAGIQQALEKKELSIRQIGDPGHVSVCHYLSYEEYGIHLVMTGDIIMDSGVFDENAGFNFIMSQRIKDSLGRAVFESLGKKGTGRIDIDDSQLQTLFTSLYVDNKTDSTLYVKMNESKLLQTAFKHLRGVIFIDALTKKQFSYSELLQGIELKCRGDRERRSYLKINFSEYENPAFCTRDDLIWILPINFRE